MDFTLQQIIKHKIKIIAVKEKKLWGKKKSKTHHAIDHSFTKFVLKRCIRVKE